MNALLTNPFKERLRKGEVQIGLWLSSTTAYMAEIAATSGYKTCDDSFRYTTCKNNR